MKLENIGEFGLIERFREKIRLDPTVIVGSGDDCAVLKLDKTKFQLFTCDVIVEGVDFNRRDSPQLIGRKAVAQSISDIAACGGIPRHCVASIGLPKATPVRFVDEVFKGANGLAREYKINIVGGDLTRADRLFIDVSMLGIVEKKNLVLRSGAKQADIIFVTGSLGGSIRGKHLKFTPRLKEARFLVNNFKINSMIDISDGLVQDLMHVLKASGCGAKLFRGMIPLSNDARDLSEALHMGEDFELLFTVSRQIAKKLLPLWHIIRPIGEVMPEKYGLKLVDGKGREKKLTACGYKHF